MNLKTFSRESTPLLNLLVFKYVSQSWRQVENFDWELKSGIAVLARSEIEGRSGLSGLLSITPAKGHRLARGWGIGKI